MSELAAGLHQQEGVVEAGELLHGGSSWARRPPARRANDSGPREDPWYLSLPDRPNEGGQRMTARKKVSATKRIQNAQKRARDAVEEGLRDLERRLPSNLRSAVRDMRANLRAFQQQLERARQDREARWRRMQTQMRRDMVRLLQRLEKALAPSAQRACERARASSPRRKKR